MRKGRSGGQASPTEKAEECLEICTLYGVLMGHFPQLLPWKPSILTDSDLTDAPDVAAVPHRGVLTL